MCQQLLNVFSMMLFIEKQTNILITRHVPDQTPDQPNSLLELNLLLVSMSSKCTCQLAYMTSDIMVEPELRYYYYLFFWYVVNV